jgi:DinB superfamily
MDSKQRIIWQLQTVRALNEQMFASFVKPEDWVHQIFPGANHALWIAGHLAMVDNSGISRFIPAQGVDKGDWSKKFGRQSTPTSNFADYPPPAEVLAFMRERRATLVKCLEGFSEADFDQPAPPGLPPFIHNAGQLYSFMAVHEGLHTGQLSMCRRSLGNTPVVG